MPPVAAKAKPRFNFSEEELKRLHDDVLGGLVEESSSDDGGDADEGAAQAPPAASSSRPGRGGRGRPPAGPGRGASGAVGRGEGGRGAGRAGVQGRAGAEAAAGAPSGGGGRKTEKSAKKSVPVPSEETELTEAVALVAASQGAFEPVEKVEDITQLLFRNRGLESLATPRTVPFHRLAGSLEILSLSSNRLKDIEPLSSLVSLVEVNINFNQIVDISPLFECEMLEKLFASHNSISSISGLEDGCPQICELSLLANRLDHIESLSESLRGLPELRSLDLGQNPCMEGSGARYSLLQALPRLEQLDRSQVTNLDRSLASSFLQSRGSWGSGDGSAPGATGGGTGAESGAGSSASADEASPISRLGGARPMTAHPVSFSTAALLGGGSGGYPPGAGGGSSGSGGGSSRGAPLAMTPLPWQKLRSSRANRIDDVLTQVASSREPSPEVEDGVPTLAGDEGASDVGRTLKVLKAHSTVLAQRLDTLQMERDNLRFQVRLLQRDQQEAHPDWLAEKVAQLEVEARNFPAVRSEREQLDTRLAQVERALAELSGGSADAGAGRPEVGLGGGGEDEDAVDELRWEGKLLEKRLDRMTRAVDKLRQDALRAQLQSSHMRLSSAAGESGGGAESPPKSALKRLGTGRPGTCASLAVAAAASSAAASLATADSEDQDPEVSRLLAANEARLRELREEVRDTATAISLGRPMQQAPPAGHRAGAVDVLTFGEGEDVEWHSTK